MTLARFGIFILFSLGSSLLSLGAEPSAWVTIFEESFKDNPTQRFKMLPVPEPGTTSTQGSGRYDDERDAYTLGGRMSFVRPVRAGAHVELGVTLQFLAPEPGDPPKPETDLMFVLFDRSMIGVQILPAQKDGAPAIIRFVQERAQPPESKVLREIQQPGGDFNGEWLLRYRHGLLTLLQGTSTLGSADINRLGVQVAGVSWIQKGGRSTCERMVLTGEPLREITPHEQELLQNASRLNQEARKLLGEQKAEEALVKMQEASRLYVEVHGENHHDSANSFSNLATILGTMGRTDEAGPLWAKALEIHEKTLGANHPHTTLTRFNQGQHFLKIGDKAKAKASWTRCRDDWKSVLGPEYSLVKALDSILQRL